MGIRVGFGETREDLLRLWNEEAVKLWVGGSEVGRLGVDEENICLCLRFPPRYGRMASRSSFAHIPRLSKRPSKVG